MRVVAGAGVIVEQRHSLNTGGRISATMRV
jgi:hypothetical protein